MNDACLQVFLLQTEGKKKNQKVTDIMQKEYKAGVVLSMIMPSGKRVTFDELSGGNGGVFVTDDEALQKELESHAWFGSKFKLRQQKYCTVATGQSEGQKAKDKGKNQPVQEIEISDPGEAKEWLAEHFQDVSRTKLRTVEAIKAMAAQKGIIFKGL